jgi:hypothetical protein
MWGSAPPLAMGDPSEGRRATVWNRIKAAVGRLWRPRRRRAAEHGFYDQRTAGQHRSQQDIDQARGRGTVQGRLASDA